MREVDFGSFRTSRRCQEIDSPSRSSSVASQILSAALAAFFSSEMIFLCPSSISYSTSKVVLSTLTSFLI